MEKSFLAGAACLLATARPEAERLRQMIPGPRVVSLPLGLSGQAEPDYAAARAALGWRDDERVLLFLSRIHVKKGLDLLLRALAETEVPGDVRLVIVGGGEPRFVSRQKRLAAELAAQLPRVDCSAKSGARNAGNISKAPIFFACRRIRKTSASPCSKRARSARPR